MILGDISTLGSGGGGSGKMIQQLKLPISMVYDEFTSAKAWGSTSVSKLYDGKGVDLCADGCLYSMTPGQVLYTLNCTTNEFTSAQYGGGIRGVHIGLFKYNSELFIMTLYASTGDLTSYYYYVYKINETTKTFTEIKGFMSGSFQSRITGTITSGTEYCHEHNPLYTALPIDDNHIGVCYISRLYTIARTSTRDTWRYQGPISHFFIYDAFTNEFSVDYSKSSSAPSITDSNPNGKTYIKLSQRKENKVRILLNTGAEWKAITTGNTLIMYEINLEANPITVVAVGIGGNMLPLLNNNEQKIDSVQVGDKVMYLSSVPMSGKFTGEIDLFEMTYNSLKYPDIPTDAPKMDAANYNLHFVNDQVRSITLTGSDVYTWSSKIFSLDLTPKPPQLNPLAVKIFKGEKYNILSGMDLDILGLSSPAQPSFTLTGQQQIAPQDLEIHLGQYQLSGMPVDIVIEKG